MFFPPVRSKSLGFYLCVENTALCWFTFLSISQFAAGSKHTVSKWSWESSLWGSKQRSIFQQSRILLHILLRVVDENIRSWIWESNSQFVLHIKLHVCFRLMNSVVWLIWMKTSLKPDRLGHHEIRIDSSYFFFYGILQFVNNVLSFISKYEKKSLT